MSSAAFSKRILRIVLFAMWVSVLMPALSGSGGTKGLAGANGAGSTWVEVCGPDGVTSINLAAQWSPAGSAESEPDQHEHREPCPYCHLQLAQHMPPMRTAWLRPIVEPPLLPVLYLLAPRRMFAWAHAPAQAPPSV